MIKWRPDATSVRCITCACVSGPCVRAPSCARGRKGESRMGKYMRKRSVGRTPADVELGVRTRSRSAALLASAAGAAAAEAEALAEEAPAPKRPRKQATARGEAEAVVSGKDGGGGAAPGGCCYLQLRSRRLFMPAGGEVQQCPVVPPSPAAAAAVGRSGSASVEPVDVVAGISRCSSSASSVDVVVVLPAVAPARERTGGAEAEVPRDDDDDCECDVESVVVSDSAGCRHRRRRDRRETTPTSSRTPVDLSDEEWSQATDDDPKSHRRTANAVAACRSAARMTPAGEIDAFFVAAEKAQAERFAAKYNFDVARGVPLGAGRYEWTPVASG